MNHPIKIYLILWLVLLTNLGFSQSSLEEDRGDVFLESFEFDKAIKLYQTAYNSDSNNVQLTRKIADAFRRKGDLASSAAWYEATLALDTSRKEDMLYYAEALKTLKRYDESLIWYEKYNALQPKDERAENHILNSNYHEDLAEDSLMYVIDKLDFNNKKPAFGVTKYEDKLVFSATGFANQKFNKTNPWNNLPYLDVYEADIDENNQAVDIKPINEINSKYNDGPAHYDETSETIFVTRNNMRRGKPVKDKTGSVNLKIYSSKRVDGNWSDMEELTFNSNDYSTGHPAITEDGKYLYFASNRPGGEGGTDIYVSERINDTWSHPDNIGNKVNTKGNEMFPYVDDNNILYFSSTGHAGLGGLDIFKIDIDSLNSSDPINIGYPINSAKDDFSILFEQVDKSGYFCSNRDRGYSDDIYYFEMNNALQKLYAGRIESSLPEKSLAGNTLIVRNLETGEEQPLILGEDGEFEFEAIPGNTYELAYQKVDVEEILMVKTVEGIIEEEFENLGIFTIQERMIVNIYNDGEDLEINDVLFKRFAENGHFLTQEGDTLSNVDMMDIITKNLHGNDIELNDELYKLDASENTYVQEDGEYIEDIELESLLISEILINPLDLKDDSSLAGADPLNPLDGMLDSSIEMPEMEMLNALEWVNNALEDKSLSEQQKMELKTLQSSDLALIEASEWLKIYANNPEKAASLSSVERKALGLDFKEVVEKESNEEDHIATEPITVMPVTPIYTANPEDYVVKDKEELKVTLTNKGIENIYFNFDKSSIRPDARPILDEVAKLLSVNNGVTLFVNAHTDARGSNAYNQKLSEKRAQTVKSYLKARGIDPNRLKLSWFGEDQLTNECGDGASCEENAHELNRRAVFALVGDISTSTSIASTTAAVKSEAPKTQPGQSDAELAGAAGLEQIYYNYDKHNIRPDAQIILNGVAETMKANQRAIVINAHTDARGSNAYNTVLSEQRAISAKEYLTNLGISADRISINWAGETQLSNGCSDGITCMSNEHQRNRRATLVWK